MNIKRLWINKFTLILLICISISCDPQPDQSTSTEYPRDEELAQQALNTFLEDLHHGKYDEAAGLYGGSYDILIDYNPDINPKNLSALWRNACTVNGIQCLEAEIVGLEEKTTDSHFIFLVEFINDDGSLFELTPCCSSEESDSPEISIFQFTVVKDDSGRFSILDMPPYVP